MVPATSPSSPPIPRWPQRRHRHLCRDASGTRSLRRLGRGRGHQPGQRRPGPWRALHCGRACVSGASRESRTTP